MHARSFAVAALTALCLAATAGASIDITSTVRFGFVPQKAFPGQPASLSVDRPAERSSVQRVDPVRRRLAAQASERGCPCRQGLVALDDSGQGQDRGRVRDGRL